MESVNNFTVAQGSNFDNIIQSSESSEKPFDDVVAEYLDNNPEGLEFEDNGKTYRLSKDPETGNYVMHEKKGDEYVLKDPDVQINSEDTPDGLIEIGGMGQVGSRFFVGQSPDNPEQLITFRADHSIDETFRPDDAAVIFDGAQVQVEEEGGTEGTGLTDNTGSTGTTEGATDQSAALDTMTSDLGAAHSSAYSALAADPSAAGQIALDRQEAVGAAIDAAENSGMDRELATAIAKSTDKAGAEAYSASLAAGNSTSVAAADAGTAVAVAGAAAKTAYNDTIANGADPATAGQAALAAANAAGNSYVSALTSGANSSDAANTAMAVGESAAADTTVGVAYNDSIASGADPTAVSDDVEAARESVGGASEPVVGSDTKSLSDFLFAAAETYAPGADSDPTTISNSQLLMMAEKSGVASGAAMDYMSGMQDVAIDARNAALGEVSTEAANFAAYAAATAYADAISNGADLEIVKLMDSHSL